VNNLTKVALSPGSCDWAVGGPTLPDERLLPKQREPSLAEAASRKGTRQRAKATVQVLRWSRENHRDNGPLRSCLRIDPSSSALCQAPAHTGARARYPQPYPSRQAGDRTPLACRARPAGRPAGVGFPSTRIVTAQNVSENSVRVSCWSSSSSLVLEPPRKTEDEGRRTRTSTKRPHIFQTRSQTPGPLEGTAGTSADSRAPGRVSRLDSLTTESPSGHALGWALPGWATH
jgi:hypothetical protein